jgi:hypothetical protein
VAGAGWSVRRHGVETGSSLTAEGRSPAGHELIVGHM